MPFPSPGEDLPDPGIEPGSPALQADSLPSKPSGKPQSVFSYINEMSFETSKVEGFPGGSDGKASVYNAGDLGSIPGLGRSSPGEGNGNPLQYSCLENPTDRGAW